MERRAVWILNLDAELEWSGSSPSPDILAALPEVARAAAQSLLGPQDVVLADEPITDCVGRAWCPTESARERFQLAGIHPEPWPELDVVRRANHRGTWFEQGLQSADCAWVTDMQSLDALLSSMAAGTRLRLKRAFTVAGRGHRRWTVARETEADQGWVRRAIELGGVAVEPERDVMREWSMHGRLSADGSLQLGRSVQHRTRQDHWVAAEPAIGLAPTDAQQLASQAHSVASALTGMGYFGPFGIDAMHVREFDGTTRFVPLTEVNARYTLSYPASGLTSD